MKNKLLLIGNDPTIEYIDFPRIQKDIITVGTNRAWLKTIPNYLFFHDQKIFQELDENVNRLNQLKAHTKIISSDWLEINCKRTGLQVPNYTTIYERPNKTKYVDCVTTAIDILERDKFKKRDTIFYVAGVSLTWKTPSHFWKKNPIEGIGNTNDRDWHNKRFQMTFTNFENLKKRGFNIVSVTPDSKINKIFRYENIGNLYG